jgi:hypothetical protein
MSTTRSLLLGAAIVLATSGLGVAAASAKDEHRHRGTEIWWNGCLIFYHSPDGRSVALESVLEGGRVVRYVAAADNRLASAERVSDNPLTTR